MSVEKLFETASRKKYRYQFRGVLTTEDLWDLSPENLDAIFKVLNAEAKKAAEESLLQTKTATTEELENKIEIIKYIVAEKVAKREKAKKARENAEKRQKILQALEEKSENALKEKTPEELQAMLKELED